MYIYTYTHVMYVLLTYYQGKFRNREMKQMTLKQMTFKTHLTRLEAINNRRERCRTIHKEEINFKVSTGTFTLYFD